MRLILTLAAAASVTSTAAAQPYGWIIEVHDPILGPIGSSFPQETEITVWAKFDDTVDYAMGAGQFDLVASEAGIAGANWHSNELLPPLDFIKIDAGTLTATGAVEVKAGQIHFPLGGFVADPVNPAPAWRITYTATDFAPRDIDLVTVTDRFRVYDNPLASSSHEIALASLMEGAGVITIVPAPASLALLALAGLALPRRKR